MECPKCHTLMHGECLDTPDGVDEYYSCYRCGAYVPLVSYVESPPEATFLFAPKATDQHAACILNDSLDYVESQLASGRTWRGLSMVLGKRYGVRIGINQLKGLYEMVNGN